jgi:nicotinate-nucleotide adenylyltransferase
MTARRLGILGGTFDPVHCGHLDIGTAADDALGLSELWLVPSHLPPHRPSPAASSYHRFAMVAMAVAGRPHWQASDLELASAARSFTSSTLDRLAAIGYAATEIVFIVGADAFADIATWKDYPAIVDRAHFAVISRPGSSALDLPRRLPPLAPRMMIPAPIGATGWEPIGGPGEAPATAAGEVDRPAIFLIDAATANVSSTDIRVRRRDGQSIAGLVPPAVQQHIEQHGLYTWSGVGTRGV